LIFPNLYGCIALSNLLYVNEVITSKLKHFTRQNIESGVAQAGICSLFFHIVSLQAWQMSHCFWKKLLYLQLVHCANWRPTPKGEQWFWIQKYSKIYWACVSCM